MKSSTITPALIETVDGGAQGLPRHDDLAVGVAAVAELLARSSPSIGELAARLGVTSDDLERALDLPSVAPLVAREPGGALHAAPGATSATLPRRERLALAPRRQRRALGPRRA